MYAFCRSKWAENSRAEQENKLRRFPTDRKSIFESWRVNNSCWLIPLSERNHSSKLDHLSHHAQPIQWRRSQNLNAILAIFRFFFLFLFFVIRRHEPLIATINHIKFYRRYFYAHKQTNKIKFEFENELVHFHHCINLSTARWLCDSWKSHE